MTTAKEGLHEHHRMISLPQELIDAIVSLVDDSESLKACSLVSTAFVAPAQRIILRSLYIEQTSSSSRRSGRNEQAILSIHRAHAALQASPHISSYIRELKIRVYAPLSDTQQTLLEHILFAASSIEILELSGSKFKSGRTKFPLQLLPSFLAVLRLPSLEHTCLVNIYAVPSSFLSLAMMSSRNVWLQNIGVVEKDMDVSTLIGLGASANNTRLECLHIRGKAIPNTVYSAMELILDSETPEYMRHLHTLEVPVASGWKTLGCKIIAAAATTVQHLVIDYGDCYRFRPNSGLQLPLLPTLCSIALTLFLGWVRRLPEDLYSTIAALPDAIPNVERINLILVLDSLEQQVPWQDSGVFALFDGSSTGEWRARLPQLRRLDCCLGLTSNESNPQAVQDAVFAEFVANMEERFPGLRGTGILTFSRGIKNELEQW
ncbi:hypothetical protein B0H19DRAFT_1259730 [Mycena capillaripes]|nr:hypothetical protein B0H19DRAFT_1259730 [Mycena capillaripes]